MVGKMNQDKLNKSEWNGIEIPVNEQEKQVLTMLINGYDDVNIKYNVNLSVFSLLKIEKSDKLDEYIYVTFIRPLYVSTVVSNVKVSDMKLKLNSRDMIRANRFVMSESNAYELVLIRYLNGLSNVGVSVKDKCVLFYTLYNLSRVSVEGLNVYLMEDVNLLLDKCEKEVLLSNMLLYASDILEKNDDLLRYMDWTLYEHQKEVFSLARRPGAKLILYTAPTGTGKTMTPIALSKTNKIIFVCAARHVGLALAKASISMNKRIAFAFGCDSADDIRLHYFSAKEYIKNKKTGGIGKVDNSIGDNIEIIICDIKSYLPAMYYMLAFFPKEQIITYWDEPTISMDYEHHPFHETIHQNWKENLIPNIILSSATLPKEHEINDTISDFKNTFPNSIIHNIISHDCKKSIPLLSKDGFIIMPHYLSNNYNTIKDITRRCLSYPTILRYFDLNEISSFLSILIQQQQLPQRYNPDLFFEHISNINMKSIKHYYLNILSHLNPNSWTQLYNYFISIRQPKFTINNPSFNTTLKKSNSVDNNTPLQGTSGIYVSTSDAYTLTDGPAIFLTSDVDKIARFCIQQAKIPEIVMEDIAQKINFNNALSEQITSLENEINTFKDNQDNNTTHKSFEGHDVSSRTQTKKDPKKINRDVPEEISNKNQISRLTTQINGLYKNMKRIMLNELFVPNKKHHLEKWASTKSHENTFTSNIDEQTVVSIMALQEVNTTYKLLLMMGIGVFKEHICTKYMEIMKQLADSQNLYLIVASSDYIYGTNYQFCHGFISKDLENITFEKILQAMGRIGRNNIQQTYTIRFRDDIFIDNLFISPPHRPEVNIMNRLFSNHIPIDHPIIETTFPEKSQKTEPPKTPQKDNKEKEKEKEIIITDIPDNWDD